MYKPPNNQFEVPALGHGDLPHIVIRDFNSHCTSWSYDLTLIHDGKLPKSFNSVRCKKGYNPDLIFASAINVNMCKKSIMDLIPHTQHRFNLMKTDWNGYSIEDVEPIPANYKCCVKSIRVVSFSENEYRKGVVVPKNNKVAGRYVFFGGATISVPKPTGGP